MTTFWKRHNPRIAKILATEGVPEHWRTRDWYVDIEGLEDVNGAAEALKRAFSQASLGDVHVVGRVVRCSVSRKNAIYSVLLARETLRDLGVPQSALIRDGFPTPTVAKRIYAIDRKSNLEKIGKASRTKPSRGDVFAYSFDKRRYHWGLVLRNDVTGVWAEAVLLVCFFKAATDTLKPPAELSANGLLLPPLFVDDGCWKQGLFVTVENREVGPEHTADLCFEVKGALPGVPTMYVDDYGDRRARAAVCGSWAVSPWTSIDAELSMAHGVPLLA